MNSDEVPVRFTKISFLATRKRRWGGLGFVLLAPLLGTGEDYFPGLAGLLLLGSKLLLPRERPLLFPLPLLQHRLGDQHLRFSAVAISNPLCQNNKEGESDRNGERECLRRRLWCLCCGSLRVGLGFWRWNGRTPHPTVGVVAGP